MEKRNILLSKSPVNVILQLTKGDQSISDIAREIQSTFAHVHNIVNIFEDYGYVESKMIGSRRICKLSEKGSNVVEKIQSLLKI